MGKLPTVLKHDRHTAVQVKCWKVIGDKSHAVIFGNSASSFALWVRRGNELAFQKSFGTVEEAFRAAVKILSTTRNTAQERVE